MTLGELIRALEELRDDGIPDNAPIIVEGHDDDDRFVQAHVEDVKAESRCEDDDEPPGVYLGLEEVTVDE